MKKVKILFLFLILMVVLVCWNYNHISTSTGHHIFTDVNQLEAVEYGLLLGTPKYSSTGRVNPYYQYRIEAALELYNYGKIATIIISGATTNIRGENEIELMKVDLRENGVRLDDIREDELGSRTWDSISNIKNKYQHAKIIVISQRFHLERALYIADRKNLTLFGFDAKGKITNKMRIREAFARIKMQGELFSLFFDSHSKKY